MIKYSKTREHVAVRSGLGLRLVLSAGLLFGSGAAALHAAEPGGGHGGPGGRNAGGERGGGFHGGGPHGGGFGDYRGNRGRGGWGGGYYRAPPLVYGSPYYNNCAWPNAYYCAPPVVYGPGIGIGLPGVSVGIY